MQVPLVKRPYNPIPTGLPNNYKTEQNVSVLYFCIIMDISNATPLVGKYLKIQIASLFITIFSWQF